MHWLISLIVGLLCIVILIWKVSACTSLLGKIQETVIICSKLCYCMGKITLSRENKGYVLVIPWFMRMYDVIMHERERVHYRTYMRTTMV